MEDINKLQKEYERMMKEAYKLSHKNRTASDQKYYEADMLARKIEQLQKQAS